jgi:hypothetical protein
MLSLVGRHHKKQPAGYLSHIEQVFLLGFHSQTSPTIFSMLPSVVQAGQHPVAAEDA